MASPSLKDTDIWNDQDSPEPELPEFKATKLTFTSHQYQNRCILPLTYGFMCDVTWFCPLVATTDTHGGCYVAIFGCSTQTCDKVTVAE